MVIEDRTTSHVLDLPSHPQCYPSLRWQMIRLLLCWYKLSMEGTPPPRGAEKGQRQACSWKRPRLYLPVRRLALPVETSGGGGSSHHQLQGRGGATQPGWRLPPRESLRAQGQHQSPTRLVTFNVPADQGPPYKRFQWKSPFEDQVIQWVSMSPKQEKPQVIGEFMAILIYVAWI